MSNTSVANWYKTTHFYDMPVVEKFCREVLEKLREKVVRLPNEIRYTKLDVGTFRRLL